MFLLKIIVCYNYRVRRIRVENFGHEQFLREKNGILLFKSFIN